MKRDMQIRPIESGPLTDREIEELDAFLLAEDGLENGASASLQRPPYFRPFQYFGHTDRADGAPLAAVRPTDLNTVLGIHRGPLIAATCQSTARTGRFIEIGHLERRRLPPRPRFF
jgi:hypothetical protein